MSKKNERIGKYFVTLIAGSLYFFILFVIVDDLSDTSPIFAAITGATLLSAVAWALIVFHPNWNLILNNSSSGQSLRARSPCWL